MIFVRFNHLKWILLLGSLVIIFFSLSYSVSSASMSYESHIATESSKIEFIGGVAGGQFGAEVASGDFNGDGIDDLFIASPFASITTKEWNGAARVVFGKSSGSRNPDISYIDFLGEYSGDQLGTSISVGDYNNDGIDDVALGAHNAYYSNNKYRPGKVYIILGKTSWGSRLTSRMDSQTGSQVDSWTMDLNSIKPDFRLVGRVSGDGFGLSLESFDVNNDGFDDLLVGAPFASALELSNSGIVYAYLGSVDGLPDTHDLIYYGQSKNERFGSSIAGGDVNGDGLADVAIGAYLSSIDEINQTGKVYFYAGALEHPSVMLSPTLSFKGTADKEWFGFSLDMGDTDNDGKDDLAISSFPYGGRRSSARVSVFSGDENFAEGVADIVISNPVDESLLGAMVLLGDLNSDNKAEIIMGAPSVSRAKSTDEGDVYILYSNGGGYESSYSVKNRDISAFIHGENSDDWFGYSVESLDFNSDGYQDLAIGSRYSDAVDSVNNGKVFVLLGKGLPFGKLIAAVNTEEPGINRGEFIKIVLDSFDIKNKKSDLIQNCYAYKDFCLFNFVAMSSYNDIQLEPNIILYPDVSPDDEYFEEITIATILGLVHGYMDDPDSPFRPNLSVSRIQALKVVFGAAGLVPPKYKFQLISLLGSYKDLISQISYFADIDSRIAYMWWYPRYVNFAVDNDIIDKVEFFRPHENITLDELNDLINKTLEYINSRDEENKS